jgi:hypothetical protein
VRRLRERERERENKTKALFDALQLLQGTLTASAVTVTPPWLYLSKSKYPLPAPVTLLPTGYWQLLPRNYIYLTIVGPKA